jgi:4-hydroxy-tetrahydrodipicolinate synthase
MVKKYQGVFSVICTPFDDREEIDEAALRRHIRWLIDEGRVHAIIPCGSTGEFAALSAAERRQVVEITLDEVKHQLPVIAGAAACSTRETIQNAREYQKMGADGVMVVPPYYGHISQDEIYDHYASLARSVDLPVMVYNNPGTSGSDILPLTLARLAAFDNVVAVKESSGQMQRVVDIQQRCEERLEVLCGCDTLPLEMFAMGVRGWVAAPSNIIPRECVALYELAALQADFKAAGELYARIRPLFELFEESGQYVQLAKAGLTLMGRSMGLPRRPLLPPSHELIARLRVLLDSIAAQPVTVAERS